MIVEHNPTSGTFELFWPGFAKQLFDLGKRRDYESLRKFSGLITASIHACTLPPQYLRITPGSGYSTVMLR